MYSRLFIALVFSVLMWQLVVPEFSLETIPDEYRWRETLVTLYMRYKYTAGDRVFPNAVIGREGWFFFTGDTGIHGYQKTYPLNFSNVKKMNALLAQIGEAAEKNGGTFLVMVAPDKSTIYHQYMPVQIPVIGEESSADRYFENLMGLDPSTVLDLRPALMSASGQSQVYYKTDSHWNCEGALIAYREVAFNLAEIDPRVYVYDRGDFEFLVSQDTVLDISKMMKLEVMEGAVEAVPAFPVQSVIETRQLLQADSSMKIVSNPGQDLPRLMIFHDSFYPTCFENFIHPTFGVTMSVPYQDVKLPELLGLIETEKPDFVVVEFIERNFEFFLRHFVD